MEHTGIQRTPWERRLEDLSHTLNSCGKSYFDPDLFRQNVNHFLQTARTVTFIIQKNKSEIKDFENWYTACVQNPLKQDAIMDWAKDARNVIEKEGDLELHSTLQVSLLTSYLCEDDIHINCGRDELLGASIKRLVKLAYNKYPRGVTEAAALRIERTWITSKLPQHELLWALSYVYVRLYECVEALATHLGRCLPASIPCPSGFIQSREDARQVKFLKLRDLQTYNISMSCIPALKEDEMPKHVTETFAALKHELQKPTDFITLVEYYESMAAATFKKWGNHVPMVFLIGPEWSPIGMLSAAYVDQTEKYLLWRYIGERVALEKVRAVVFTAEVWLRDMRGYPRLSVSELSIIGEKLQVTVVDYDRNYAVRSWDIEHSHDGKANLKSDAASDEALEQPFFLVPVIRGMGNEPEFLHAQGKGGC